MPAGDVTISIVPLIVRWAQRHFDEAIQDIGPDWTEATMVAFANSRENANSGRGALCIPYQAHTKARTIALQGGAFFSNMATTTIRFGSDMQRFGDSLICWGWNWGYSPRLFPKISKEFSMMEMIG